MNNSSNITYRIHAQKFSSGPKFVSALSSDFTTIAFKTKASFQEQERFILDIRFKGLSEHQYFLMEVINIIHLENQINEVKAKFLPGQEQKLSYVYSIAKGNRGYLSQRLFPRFPIHLKGKWSLGDSDLLHPCEIIDLSYGGAGIKTKGVTIPHNTRIQLKLSLPGTDSITISGEVVWLKDSYIGIRFYPNQPSLKTIRRFLRNAATQAYIGID